MSKRRHRHEDPADRPVSPEAHWAHVERGIRADRRLLGGRFMAHTVIDADCQDCDAACLGPQPVVYELDLVTVRHAFASHVHELAQDHFDARAAPSPPLQIKSVRHGLYYRLLTGGPPPTRWLDGLREEAWVDAEERRIIAAGEIAVFPRIKVHQDDDGNRFGALVYGVLDVTELTVSAIDAFVTDLLLDPRSRKLGPGQRFGLEDMENYWARERAGQARHVAEVRSRDGDRHTTLRAGLQRARRRNERVR